MIQIDDKFRIFLVDGYAYVYSISSVNTGYFGNPVNRYAGFGDAHRRPDRLQHERRKHGAGSITTVMLYNDDDKRFCYLMRNDETLRNALTPNPDLALFPWRTGLDYVTTVNSRFLSGQSATIPARRPGGEILDLHLRLPCGRVPAKGGALRDRRFGSRGGRELVHDLAARLYALLGGQRALRLRFPQWPEARAAAGPRPRESTQIHGDIHTVAEGNSDCVYVCTYEAGTPDSGRIRKYAVADTADRIELQADRKIPIGRDSSASVRCGSRNCNTHNIR